MTQPDGSEEDLVLAGTGSPSATGWWARYASNLAGLSPTAKHVVEADSQLIVDSGVLGAGPAGDPRWPASQLRRGLVMGAVQSGKTASMLGVGALALDAGLDVLVVLAGTRVALWRQTFDRLLDQLDLAADTVASDLVRARLLVPTREVMASQNPIPPSDRYAMARASVRRALRDQRPLVVVAMKHTLHLRAVARGLHDAVYPALDQLGKPGHILILDDEADDGSILDAAVEQDLDPAVDALKQIPRHIADLWSTRGQPERTCSPNLYATYIGYTATPQANLLQADQNPLAPREFVIALRTPFDRGALEPRATTYLEPRGVPSYYTGGEAFYERIQGPGSLVVDDLPSVDGEPEELTRRRWIGEAMRAYLVAGAIRLWRSPARLFATSEGSVFDSPETAQAASPPTHSMLLHPSSSVEDHFSAAAEILQWAGGLDHDAALERIRQSERLLPVSELVTAINADDRPWRAWLGRFEASASAMRSAFSPYQPGAVPTDAEWPEILALLTTEVIPNVRLSIVNSDPDADDRPAFNPVEVEGGWARPRDLFTVFVSGNVMARGLTLEGLTTTAFLRSTGDPVADTQMQMQRWFGYRGPYLELCRVLAPRAQMDLFRQYHETDDGLRSQLMAEQSDNSPEAIAAVVIEGERFRATGKIAGLTKVPLCPGATPFITLTNPGHQPDPNLQLVKDIFAAPSTEVEAHGIARGRILDDTLTLLDAAALLDRLAYDTYEPDLTDQLATRWTALAAQIGLQPGDDELPLFRPPSTVGRDPITPARCPYTLAAYLRLWSACLTRHAPGLFATDDGSLPWRRVDLDERRRDAPTFSVGLRFGSIETTAGDLDLGFPIRLVRRRISDANEVTAAWGSRNPGDSPDTYLGDQLFDYHHHGATPPTAVDQGPVWRPPGAPGLLLFHILGVEGRPNPTVVVGTAIPLGGPDHFAARTSA